ncbi:MAG: 2,3-bisphosphoglycerate-independent phosphoglycerate mutase [Alphaproteobacteria bacterium]
MNSTPRPVVLCILDGWGYREAAADNAIARGQTPTWDRWWRELPHALLKTSAGDVGLPAGQMGNSEVGHQNIGAGRVVLQDLPRIDTAVADGSLAANPALTDLVAKLKASGGTCHLMGLASPGGVHAHQDHIAALARTVAGAGVPVAIHALLDGRDTPPQSAGGYLAELEQAIDGSGARIATVTGRYWAMDRDKRWERVGRAYDCVVDGKGATAGNAARAIEQSYAADQTDEFVDPTAVGGYAGMRDGDGLLMANFRADRAREILTALLDPAFDGFARSRVVRFAAQLGMVSYSAALDELIPSLFPPEKLSDTLGEVVAKAGRTQLRIAETEKYAHVTFFLNGGEERVFDGEERILVPSPKVATYDLQPEMAAPEITDRLVEAITGGGFDLIVVNYANPDMVGHTGKLDAALKAVATVDDALARLEAALGDVGGVMLVTADHGNIEQMNDAGGPHTAHTTNPVPLVMVGAAAGGLADGRLADLAPTLLTLMGLPVPAAMTGHSLLTDRPAQTAARTAGQRASA